MALISITGEMCYKILVNSYLVYNYYNISIVHSLWLITLWVNVILVSIYRQTKIVKK